MSALRIKADIAHHPDRPAYGLTASVSFAPIIKRCLVCVDRSPTRQKIFHARSPLPADVVVCRAGSATN